MNEIDVAQPNPLLALAVFAAVVLVVAIIAWPGRGVVARYKAMRRLTERVRLEDALKHLFGGQTSGHPGSTESLAGALGISGGRAVEVVRRLERMNLARLQDNHIVLTDAGREYALRIVRTHRLWERYLADRTGVTPEQWHSEAERVEHGLSEEQVEGLAARMGYPLYDPHGDPIPTAAGVLPPERGIALPAAKSGSLVQVVHIEDEPEEVFQAIRSAGIDLGSRIRVIAVGPTRVELAVEGREFSLDHLTARNLTVEPLDHDDDEADIERLDILRPGEEAEVVRVSGAVQGAQRRRLLDLGVVPGTVIKAELASASGDPVAYRIRGAMIALRGHQAREILVRRAQREAA
jgi:DtxR family transcriptional regulator, Mn-dependent transcriptional regulator